MDKFKSRALDALLLLIFLAAVAGAIAVLVMIDADDSLSVREDRDRGYAIPPCSRDFP